MPVSYWYSDGEMLASVAQDNRVEEGSLAPPCKIGHNQLFHHMPLPPKSLRWGQHEPQYMHAITCFSLCRGVILQSFVKKSKLHSSS